MEKIIASITGLSGSEADLKTLKEQLRKEESTIAKSPQLDDALAIMDPHLFSLGYLTLLAAKAGTPKLEPNRFIAQAQKGLLYCNQEHVRVWPAKLCAVGRRFTELCIETRQPLRAVKPLRQALMTLLACLPEQQQQTLTPLHADFVQACVAAKAYHAARPVVSSGEPVRSVAAPGEMGTVPRDVLTYAFFAGQVCTGLKLFANAITFFKLAVTAPAYVVSAMHVEAYKRLVLVYALQHGRPPPPLPKYVAPVVLRAIKNTPLIQPYLDLAAQCAQPLAPTAAPATAAAAVGGHSSSLTPAAASSSSSSAPASASSTSAPTASIMTGTTGSSSSSSPTASPALATATVTTTTTAVTLLPPSGGSDAHGGPGSSGAQQPLSINQLLHNCSEMFLRDKTLGLVKQVVAAVPRRAMQRATATHVTFALHELAEQVGLGGGPTAAVDAERGLLRLIESGALHAAIEQRAGTVAFLQEPPERFDSAAARHSLEASVLHAQQLARQLLGLERELAAMPGYLQRTAPEGRAGARGGGGGVWGGMGGSGEFTADDATSMFDFSSPGLFKF